MKLKNRAFDFLLHDLLRGDSEQNKERMRRTEKPPMLHLTQSPPMRVNREVALVPSATCVREIGMTYFFDRLVSLPSMQADHSGQCR